MIGSARRHRVLIVGLGYAGHRFARVVRHIEQHDPHVELVGICDRDQTVRSRESSATPTFARLEEAMRAVSPSAVVVTVNEHDHAEVLHRLAPFAPRSILCEKPLTATLAEAERLPAAVCGDVLTLNLVERHSMVLDRYFDWAGTRPGLRPLRVDFFWGKHRVADVRPTMGVVSELTHPIDLVDHLFGFEELDFVSAHGAASDFSAHHASQLDTLSFLATADDYPVLGTGSFAWPRRHRMLTALLGDDSGELHRVTLDFDEPHWDCDHLRIEAIDKRTGYKQLRLEASTHNEMFPEALRGVAKVETFVRCSLDLDGRGQGTVVDHAQALRIQRVLERLSDTVGETPTPHVSMLNGAHGPARSVGLPLASERAGS